MSVCLHGNLCREIYTKTGFIYSSKCPSNCPYFEEKYNKGHWLYIDERKAKCSQCGYTQITGGADKTGHCNIHYGVYKYCPNCGSRMVEPRESEVSE